jgi:hypothetical protein
VTYQVVDEELGPPLALDGVLLDDFSLINLAVEPEHLDLVTRGADHVILK